MKTEQDVIDHLGEPDEIIPSGGGMTSLAWKCGECNSVSNFDAPVRVPSPCPCGSIFFVKAKRVNH